MLRYITIQEMVRKTGISSKEKIKRLALNGKINIIKIDGKDMISEDFIDAIKDFQNDFEYNEKELSKEVMDFLKRWLIEHIMGTDQKYSELLVKNKQN